MRQRCSKDAVEFFLCCTTIYCWVWGLSLRVGCFPNKTPVEKTDFSFASGHQLELAPVSPLFWSTEFLRVTWMSRSWRVFSGAWTIYKWIHHCTKCWAFSQQPLIDNSPSERGRGPSTIHECPTLLTFAGINTVTKNATGWEEFISAYKLQFIIKGSRGRNSGQELEAETMEEQHCLLACFQPHIHMNNTSQYYES